MNKLFSNLKIFQRYNVLSHGFGQAAAATHPHLFELSDHLTPGITKSEYSDRRNYLVEMIHKRMNKDKDTKKDFKSNNIILITGATLKYMSHDIPYTFRQDTNFLYLTGFMEPDSLLLIESSGSSINRSILFVPRKDPHKELWEGERSGTEGSIQLTGIEQSHNMDELSKYLSSLASNTSDTALWYDPRQMMDGKIKDDVRDTIAKFVKNFSPNEVRNHALIIQSLRVVKSNAEIAVMRKSCLMASQAFVELMKFSKPGIKEADLYAKVDYECRIRGAQYLAYIPVVAGGNSANTIHYISNNRIVRNDELVLVDAGCELNGYASDITRTWPVNGKFTDAQRILYEVLLNTQEECLRIVAEVRPISLQNLYTTMISILTRELLSAGVIPQSLSNAQRLELVRELCPHHIGHYLGMDVHDTDLISRDVKLLPGMSITVEPGIYIAKNNSRCEISSNFKGIGLRIEDNIVLKETGIELLTSMCPKQISDLEKIANQPL